MAGSQGAGAGGGNEGMGGKGQAAEGQGHGKDWGLWIFAVFGGQVRRFLFFRKCLYFESKYSNTLYYK